MSSASWPVPGGRDFCFFFFSHLAPVWKLSYLIFILLFIYATSIVISPCYPSPSCNKFMTDGFPINRLAKMAKVTFSYIWIYYSTLQSCFLAFSRTQVQFELFIPFLDGRWKPEIYSTVHVGFVLLFCSSFSAFSYSVYFCLLTLSCSYIACFLCIILE